VWGGNRQNKGHFLEPPDPVIGSERVGEGALWLGEPTSLFAQERRGHNEAPNADINDSFGYSVAVDGTKVIVETQHER
jgi:hypothetical protein